MKWQAWAVLVFAGAIAIGATAGVLNLLNAESTGVARRDASPSGGASTTPKASPDHAATPAATASGPVALPVYMRPGEGEPVHWWDREIERWAAKAARFEGSTRSKGEQEAVRAEAEFVFDYCLRQEYSAQLSDCRCVAGRFIDNYYERLNKLESEEAELKKAGAGFAVEGDLLVLRRGLEDSRSHNLLIGIAQMNDSATKCAFRPGSALYQYRSCMSSWKHNRPDAEELCTCVATKFSESYMSDPSTGLNNLTGFGTQALMACEAPRK